MAIDSYTLTRNQLSKHSVPRQLAIIRGQMSSVFWQSRDQLHDARIAVFEGKGGPPSLGGEMCSSMKAACETDPSSEECKKAQRMGNFPFMPIQAGSPFFASSPWE